MHIYLYMQHHCYSYFSLFLYLFIYYQSDQLCLRQASIIANFNTIIPIISSATTYTHIKTVQCIKTCNKAAKADRDDLVTCMLKQALNLFDHVSLLFVLCNIITL